MQEIIKFSDFKIQSLEIYNFLSIQKLDIDFNDINTVLFTGDNGSGKSSILSALIFNLYGIVFDRGNYLQISLINTNIKNIDKELLKIYKLENEKIQLLTIGRYKLKEDNLVIIRGLNNKGKAFLKIVHKNKEINYKDYSVANSNLEKILKMPVNDFKNNSYFHSDIYTNIIGLMNKPKQLMDLLNQIFNLNKLEILNDYYNKKYRLIEQEYKNSIQEYKITKQNAKYFKQHLADTIATMETEKEKYQIQYDDINKVLPEILKQLEQKKSGISKIKDTIETSENQILEYQNKIKEIERIKQIVEEIKRLETEKKKLRKEHTNIFYSFPDKEKEITNKEKELNDFEKELKELKEKKDIYKKQLQEIEKEKYSLDKSMEWLLHSLQTVKEGEMIECNTCHSKITKKQLQSNYENKNNENQKKLENDILPKIKTHTNKINEIDEKINEIDKNYELLKTTIPSLKTSLHSDKDRLEYFEKEIKNKVIEIDEKKKMMVEQKIKKDLEQEIDLYQIKINDIIENTKTIKENYENMLVESSDLNTKIETNKNSLSYFKREIENKTKEIVEQNKLLKNNEIMLKYTNSSKLLAENFKNYIKYFPMKNMFNYNSELKIQIFAYYLQLLNELMIKYANILHQEYTPKFIINDKNKIKLILTNVEKYSNILYMKDIENDTEEMYENLLSQGEKKKQNIIIIFAFIEFMLFYNFNKKHLGVLLFDELSVNLDDKSIRVFYDAISSLANMYDLQILISCHELYPRDNETKNYIHNTFNTSFYAEKKEGTILTQI